jgi:hypothetical protein
MIEHQQSKYSWQVTYLGANQDPFKEAQAFGVSASSILSFGAGNIRNAYASASNNVTRMKSAVLQGTPSTSYYTQDEREASV